MGINNYSTTAASNASISSTTVINWKEGQAPSTVNNTARQVLADIREWYEDPQWVALGWAAERVSDTSFSVAGADRTDTLHEGRRLKIKDVGTNTYYGHITDSTYSASLNTITMVVDNGGSLSASISVFSVAGLRADNLSLMPETRRTHATSSTSSTNTIALTLTPALTELYAGQEFSFLSDTTNDGAVTLDVNGIGALAVQKNGAALVAGDITANDIVKVAYDGTQFQMLSPARTPVLTAAAIDYTKIDDTGKPLVQAFVGSTKSDVTGDGTNYTVIFDTEKFDSGSDFNTTTGVFTAPEDGRYYFSCNLYVGGLDASMTNAQIWIAGSNYTVYGEIKNIGAVRNASNTASMTVSGFLDMEASDTASVVLDITGSTKTADVSGNATLLLSHLNIYKLADK